MFAPQPLWLNGKSDGAFKCKKCSYRTESKAYLNQHCELYHTDHPMILYMECDGSISGRNALMNHLKTHQYIDCTGGQAAFEDGDLTKFGNDLVEASRKTGVKLYHVYRMADPGLGLDFPEWGVQGGLQAGVYQEYALPEDVKAST